MSLSFLSDAANVIIVGPNGLGKTMLAKNILHQAFCAGTPRASRSPLTCSTIWPRKTAPRN